MTSELQQQRIELERWNQLKRECARLERKADALDVLLAASEKFLTAYGAGEPTAWQDFENLVDQARAEMDALQSSQTST